VDYVFYGTLMDPDVLAAVLGRVLAPGDGMAAEIRGYRRVFRRGASYPVLVPLAGGCIDGLFVARLSTGDGARLAAFEGDDYELSATDVRLVRTGQVRAAALFLPRDPGVASEEEWGLASWQCRFKRTFLGRLRPARAATRVETAPRDLVRTP
jgi:hypothetical protein